jgi:hypothetical protein
MKKQVKHTKSRKDAPLNIGLVQPHPPFKEGNALLSRIKGIAFF